MAWRWGRCRIRGAWRPSLPAGRELRLPPAEPTAALRVTYLGAATLLFDDGATAVLTDGFFSRPGAIRTALCRLSPDPAVVDHCLRSAGIRDLAAVIATHSHYDHALDVAAVTLRTGATLVGSPSAAMVGRGGGVSEDQVCVPTPGEPLRFGAFTVTLVESAHVPPPRFPGDIPAPVVPPARVSAYRSGTCYAVHLQHGGRNLLVQGSAGCVPGALHEYGAEVVYLAIGGLARRPPSARTQYWREVVAAVGAQRVLPIHWDDMWRPLTKPLVPFPYLVDDVGRSVDFLRSMGAASNVEIRLPTAWQPTDPFLDLPATSG